ncbi:MAG TPA: MASE1 domain-containing protein [Candidatus Angelobacter sp.]|nr:MASE1 domain-containing protein [Candidatus Angelobacter sp.]
MATVSSWEQKRAFLAGLADGREAAWTKRGPRQLAKDALVILVLATIYFIVGKLGLRFASIHPSATAVWPPTGISLVAFLFLGYRMWPGIFLGALAVNLTTAGSLPVCLGIAAGNTLEGLLGAYLLNKFAGGENAFYSPKGVLAFLFYGAMVSTAVSPTFGVTSLCLGGAAPWANYGPIWLTWWLGDAVGDLVVAPLLVLWSYKPQLKWNRVRLLEVVLLLAYLFVSGLLVFEGLLSSESRHYPLEFLCVPALIWAAFRFRPRRAQLATFVLAGIAIHGTLRGFGPFVVNSRNDSLLLAQAFTGVMAVMTLLLATVVEEHIRTAAQIHEMAVTDPLTGLANYRKLMETLANEISRSDRTGRSFGVVLLDLDGLKRINDTHGHLVGSRALCRVAAALCSTIRTTDTPARYGGDEFALILPEANRRAAAQVAERISKELANDRELPSITVSFGIAVFPFNGRDMEVLLRWADAALYRMKSQAGRSRSAAHA